MAKDGEVACWFHPLTAGEALCVKGLIDTKWPTPYSRPFCGIVSRRPRVDTGESGWLWQVVFYRNVEW